ncbi:MAG: hypothetical protein HY674_21715 [Chloroflexi bacterium]|nr:hypothetical protein [Chloroflexota bacterium]
MKTLLRIVAVLSFLFPFVFGVWLLIAALSSKTEEDLLIPAAMGSFLVGNAFFVGAILLVAAEKFSRMMGANDCAA